jgi:hypothetical protein
MISVPVTLIRDAHFDDESLVLVQRIVKDQSDTSVLIKTVKLWQASPTHYEFCKAIFNERLVGFALLQGNEIKAFAVHGATRDRGVGGRVLDLLLKQTPQLALSDIEPENRLKAMLDRRLSA